MKKKEIKIAIFSAFVGIVFTAIYDLIKSKPILSTFWDSLKWLWKNLFEFQVSIWQILFILLLIFIIKKILPSRKNPSAEFLKYRTDEFDKITWKWEWGWNSLTRKYNVQKLTPLCNKCGTSTILNEIYVDNYATCPRCENFMNKLKSTEKIEAIIIDNIDRKLYLNKE